MFLQASLTAAVRNINAHNDKVAVEVVGYLLEELRDTVNFDALKQDVASANIFVGSLIFIEELADKVFFPWHRQSPKPLEAGFDRECSNGLTRNRSVLRPNQRLL